MSGIKNQFIQNKFITDDFLLQTKAAVQLYHEYAEDEPILDYHNHLPPRDIAENRRFNDLFEIWLEGDHYKWRAMRTNGVPEAYCTGDAAPYDKFLAWARTVPHTLRNPLYHWTHFELKHINSGVIYRNPNPGYGYRFGSLLIPMPASFLRMNWSARFSVSRPLWALPRIFHSEQAVIRNPVTTS